MSRSLADALPSAVALLIAVAAGSLLVLAFGEAPAAVYQLVLEGTWGNPYGLGQVLYKATTLSFTGLSVAIALRAGLFNVGAESQLAAGGFGAALLGLSLPAETPSLLAIPACVLAAASFGAAVGGLAGLLKARFGAHEVIVTILLNFVVLALLNWVVTGYLHVHETVHTPPVVPGATLPRFDSFFEGSAVNATSLLAALTLAAAGVLLFRTRFGYELRAVGHNPEAAEAAGIRPGRAWIAALALSGALAGLGGINAVLGYEHYYEDGLAGGDGFLGIAVALAGRNHPLGIPLAALLFATLSQGGLAIHALVPKQMIEVLRAVVILVMAAATPVLRRWLAAPGNG